VRGREKRKEKREKEKGGKRGQIYFPFFPLGRP
jgi:hypothetical protein